MDEEDGIAGRQAAIEHNEYLVDAVKAPVQIEVHVLRELTAGTDADSQDDGHNSSPRAHFHRPYYTTLTHLQCKVIRDPTGKCPIWDRYGIDVLPLAE